MEAQAKFYRPVQESLAHSISLARAIADCIKKRRDVDRGTGQT